MPKEINALELRKHFGRVLDELRAQKEAYIITKNGRPVAVLSLPSLPDGVPALPDGVRGETLNGIIRKKSLFIPKTHKHGLICA